MELGLESWSEMARSPLYQTEAYTHGFPAPIAYLHKVRPTRSVNILTGITNWTQCFTKKGGGEDEVENRM